MIAVADYGMGNLRSVQTALTALGARSAVTRDHDELRAAERIILPGVGAFGRAMQRLEESGLAALLTDLVKRDGKPVLGICLGMQLLCRSSTEHGHHAGLGLIDAEVQRFRVPSTTRLRIPHVGWNDVEGRDGSTLAPAGGTFYFVHSFHAVCKDPADVAGTCEHGERFPAVIERENVLGAQFHPEKSQDEGLMVLRRFLDFRALAPVGETRNTAC